jgi:hypothetical protein
VSKNHVTNGPYFTSGKGGHNVTEHFEEVSEHSEEVDVMSHVTNRPSRSLCGHKILRQIIQVIKCVTADGFLGGQIQ